MRKKSFVVYVVVLTLVFALINWFRCIPINPFIAEGLMFIIAYCLFLALGIVIFSGAQSLSNVLHGNRPSLNKKTFFTAGLIVVTPIALMIIMVLLGSPLFNASAYRDQLGESTVKEFTSDVQPIDVSQLPVVDLELASKLAEKKLGEKTALGSQVTLGEPTIQSVNNKLVWVVPLEHSGFFKWLNNLEGTPGYIIVSATDPKNVEYIEQYKIKYQPRSYFAQDLQRHVRFGETLFSGITDFSFELNDQGEPFWVVTTYKNTRFLSLPEATGVILVNAQTGEQQQYGLTNLPEWIDRIQPRKFIQNQIANQGEYVHGILNLSNKDKFKTSKSSAVVYNNGNCYMFTGLTSVGSDEATIGIVMVDLKTKEVIRYNLSGATEYAAQQSAEGKVQNLKYTASFPLVTNVNTIPTYFMTLKDKEGLIKQYAFVSIKDYTSVGTGETIEDALRNYEQVTRNSTSIDIQDNSNIKEITGTINRIAVEQIGQNIVYKIILVEYPNKIFMLSYDISEELALSVKGDKIKLSYYDTTKSIINGISFDNLEFEQSGNE